MYAHRLYIQWFPTEHYIISWANLHWREQQIALEQRPNPSSNNQAPYQGLHLVPIVLSLCHVLKHRPGCAAKSEYLQAWETVGVGSETFHLGPLSKENSRRRTERNEFSRLKKKRSFSVFEEFPEVCLPHVWKAKSSTIVGKSLERQLKDYGAQDATRLPLLPRRFH